MNRGPASSSASGRAARRPELLPDVEGYGGVRGAAAAGGGRARWRVEAGHVGGGWEAVRGGRRKAGREGREFCNGPFGRCIVGKLGSYYLDLGNTSRPLYRAL